MIVSNKNDLNGILKACETSMSIMKQASTKIVLGATSLEIDKYIGELCKKYNVKPSFLGVETFGEVYKHNSCISVNEEVLHGVPNDDRKFESGDLVKLDFGIIQDGFYTDHCFTFAINPQAQDKKLLQVGKLATENGVKHALIQNTTGDIGFAMRSTAKTNGYDLLPDYVGHGVGKSLHEPPQINPYELKGRGEVLKEGMVICVECQVLQGKTKYKYKKDNWTIVTKDKKKAVMFEYMVLITKSGPQILTDMRNWKFQS